MKRRITACSKYTLALSLVASLIASTTDGQVVCDRFKLITNVESSTLNLSVDSDLPDNTVVMISIFRTYLEKNNLDGYVDYFSERSTIGKWKSNHNISIDSQKWKSALKEKQKNLSELGLGFDVASISDTITVSIVVPVNQPNPRFGKMNSKLTGKAVVQRSGIRIVKDEIEIIKELSLGSEKEKSELMMSKGKAEHERIFNERKGLLIEKYKELMSFKNKSEFHEYGFGIGSKYNKWMKEVEGLRNFNKNNNELNIAFGDLLQLGLEYMSTKGQESNITKLYIESYNELLRKYSVK